MGDILKASEVLKGFINEMNKWELEYYPLFRKDGMESHKVSAKINLDKIFENFCTKKERKQGRQIALSCSEPPEYAPSEEVINSELNGSKCYFITQQKTGFKNKHKYTLHFKNDAWRIDKKEWLDDDEGKEKWRQSYL